LLNIKLSQKTWKQWRSEGILRPRARNIFALPVNKNYRVWGEK